LGEPVEDLEDFEVGDPKNKIQVGSQLLQEVKEMLVAFMKRNKDVFAWNHEDMLGILPLVIVHKLSHRSVNCNNLSKIVLKAPITRPRPDGVSLASGRLHFGCTIIRLWNARTLKGDVRKVELVHAISIYEA
jgi:hypothetical protein